MRERNRRQIRPLELRLSRLEDFYRTRSVALNEVQLNALSMRIVKALLGLRLTPEELDRHQAFLERYDDEREADPVYEDAPTCTLSGCNRYSSTFHYRKRSWVGTTKIFVRSQFKFETLMPRKTAPRRGGHEIPRHPAAVTERHKGRMITVRPLRTLRLRPESWKAETKLARHCGHPPHVARLSVRRGAHVLPTLGAPRTTASAWAGRCSRSPASGGAASPPPGGKWYSSAKGTDQ
jgi:hypothetical protein